MYLISENYDHLKETTFAYEESISAGSRADALSMNKVCGSEETKVDKQDSENESCEDSDEKHPDFSDCNLEKRTLSDKELEHSNGETNCCVESP